MTDTTHITRGTSLGSCPHCHRNLNATAEYLIGSVQGSDNVPPNTKGPITPVGMIANLTLTGLRIEHSCGTLTTPVQTVHRGEGILPGGPRIGGSGGPGISINVPEPAGAVDAVGEVRRHALLAAAEEQRMRAQ